MWWQCEAGNGRVWQCVCVCPGGQCSHGDTGTHTHNTLTYSILPQDPHTDKHETCFYFVGNQDCLKFPKKSVLIKMTVRGRLLDERVMLDETFTQQYQIRS